MGFNSGFNGLNILCLIMTAHFHPVSRWKMSGAIPLFFHISLCCERRRLYLCTIIPVALCKGTHIWVVQRLLDLWQVIHRWQFGGKWTNKCQISELWSVLTQKQVSCHDRYTGIAELYPKDPRHFAWHTSARVSRNLRSSYFSQMIAAAE